VPEDPVGWLYRTARNLAIDALRRERTHAQAIAAPGRRRRAALQWCSARHRASRGVAARSAFRRRDRRRTASPALRLLPRSGGRPKTI
jgi:DNA-directed RNA polymerase specialized sigma24 family protein